METHTSTDLHDEDNDSNLDELVEPDDEWSEKWREWSDGFDGSDIDEDADEWSEPEPIAEYTAGLRQPRYIVRDDDVDPTWTLSVDEWVSGLANATNTEKIQTADLLRDLGRRRWLRWLPWLSKQQWTGESLLSFLRFRAYWESSPRWWENSFWDWRTRCWYPTRSRYSLSLHDTYELVHRRLDRPPKEMIDEAWLADWLDLSLWKHGFRSFASFAVFRAGLSSVDAWIRQIDWYALDDSDGDKTVPQWNNRHRLYRYGPHIWFAKQNWYEPNPESTDGHGWTT